MRDDPIVAEIRRVRDVHAAQFHYDLDAIYRDLKARNRQVAANMFGVSRGRPNRARKQYRRNQRKAREQGRLLVC